MLHKRREHHGPGDHGPGDHGDSSGRSGHPLVARTLEVLGVEALSPRMVRVTLGGEQLAGFRTAAPTDHVRVFFPKRGRAPALPAIVDGRPEMHAGVDPHRDYTVRAYRPDAGELDIDIVVHDHGVAVRWVTSATADDLLGVVGPRWSATLPEDCDWYLFGVDATALPATERWLSELPAGITTTVIAQVADAAEERDLHTAAELDLRWLHGDGPALEEAVRALGLPEGRGYVWVAGETDAVAPLRGYFRHELGLLTDHYDIDGYWRRGRGGQGRFGPVRED